MAYTIYEYQSVTPNGEPVEPPSKRTADQAVGSAVLLEPSTVYVAIKASAGTYIRISSAGSAATSADHLIPVGETRGFPVAEYARRYVYGINA